MLNILASLAAGAGLLSLCALFGGISFGQVAILMAVTASSGVAGGAMGLLVALWRDRSFQAISLTILMVVFSVAGVEAFARAFPTVTALGVPLAEVLNPYRAMFAVIYPRSEELAGVMGASSLVYILVRLAGAALLVAFATVMLRVWNPGRNEPREQREGEGQAEVVETLVEVEEAVVEAPVAVGSAASNASGVDPAMAGSRPGPVLSPAPRPGPGPIVRRARPDDRAARPPTHAPPDHPDRRGLPPPLGQPDPLARDEDPRLRDEAPDHQGGVRPDLRHRRRALQ